MKVLLNYAHNRFLEAQKRNTESGKAHGFDIVHPFGAADIDPTFASANAKILTQSRGAGYWLWKPHLIGRVLSMYPDDTVVMYADSGSEFISPAEPLLRTTDLCPVITIQLDALERQYTKGDTFMLMGCDSPRFRDSGQKLGSFVVLRNGTFARAFVAAWEKFATDERILTDLPSVQPNAPDFIDHRHDQSVLSLLSKRWDLLSFSDPAGEGEPTRPFRRIMYHHRHPA